MMYEYANGKCRQGIVNDVSHELVLLSLLSAREETSTSNIYIMIEYFSGRVNYELGIYEMALIPANQPFIILGLILRKLPQAIYI